MRAAHRSGAGRAAHSGRTPGSRRVASADPPPFMRVSHRVDRAHRDSPEGSAWRSADERRAIGVWYLSPMRLRHRLSPLVLAAGNGVRDGRLAAGWTQHELGARLTVDQSTVSRIETAKLPNVSLELAGRALDVVGARVAVFVDGPFLADRRLQRDAAHVRGVAYVRRRLERSGWEVRQEVEIGEGRLRGWIDLLAFDPQARALVTSEFKSALPDVGGAERQLDWYHRHASQAARRFGWRPLTSHALLLLLATEANDERVRANADALGVALPGRAREFAPWLADRSVASPPRRGLAMIDPFDRRARWVRPTKTDGRRTAAPYVDYADFMRRLRGGR